MSGAPGRGCGPRPHIWKSGPDLQRHEQYTAFLRQRAQANFRKEQWQLTFEQFVTLWQDLWTQRGRTSTDLCMSRWNYDLPWNVENCKIMSRGEHVRVSSEIKIARGQTGPKHKRKLRPE